MHGLAPGEELSSAAFSSTNFGPGWVDGMGTALSNVDLRFISLSHSSTGDDVVAQILGGNQPH